MRSNEPQSIRDMCFYISITKTLYTQMFSIWSRLSEIFLNIHICSETVEKGVNQHSKHLKPKALECLIQAHMKSFNWVWVHGALDRNKTEYAAMKS